MPFTRASTWKERGLQAQAVKDACNAIIDRLGLPQTDARVLAMIHVRQFSNTLAAVPIKLQQNAERPANVPLIVTLLGLSDPRDLRSMLGDLNKNAKASFLTMVQFALEHCVEQVLNALPGTRGLGRFAASAARLVKVSGIGPPQDKGALLLVPAWIRNTLHANGIHSRDSKTVVVDGETYSFVQGERVSCASWSHMFHAVVCALVVYEEIFFSKPVSDLPRIDAL